MKQFKLFVHQKNFSEESLVINQKDFPSLKTRDIVEIYSPEDEYSRLLLQVTSFKEELQKDTISIEQSIASNFQLRTYADVIVNIVNPKDVALDSVELTFKDQYLARSDMWRIKKCLINTCVYINKKIEFYSIRCQVFEMWSQGERVSCGVITPDSKIVYRSASSMVYLFLQMSSEMWDFDINGDLYFEKAVNGFLSDLFAKWKKLSCNHDVTIVLFSRTFYEAHSTEEFPEYMRECLQQDYKGRFYEDFYRVAVQNERYDDWSSVLIILKKLFNKYQQMVLECHQKPGIKIPHAVNSTSSQGNFLEVLNMSLNVFEKHYMDRSFDRTGQLSVVISPGVGVFEVDRELTNITKQRIIDNGIGSDLVCLGEQPLHAVPLFKFHNKQKSSNVTTVIDDYNMPHWINLSFYSSTKQISYSNFVPRIKLPMPFTKSSEKEKGKIVYTKRPHYINQSDSFPSLFNFDEYDEYIFKLPSHSQNSRTTHSLQRHSSRRKATLPSNNHPRTILPRRMSEDKTSTTCFVASETIPEPKSVYVPSPAITIPLPNSQSNICYLSSSLGTPYVPVREVTLKRPLSRDDLDPDFSPPFRSIVGSADSHEQINTHKIIHCHSRALVNPFDPSHVTIKLTSNRRRWTHVFPLGPTGIFMQQHHYQAVPHNTAATLIPADMDKDLVLSHELLPVSILTSENFCKKITSNANHLSTSEDIFDNERYHPDGKKAKEMHSSASSASLSGADNIIRIRSSTRTSTIIPPEPPSNRSTSWLWGATGEQEWTPALTTGVDWKSLVIPACLPITTDYFPDKRSLQNDYVVSDYFLLPEDISMDLTQRRCYRDNEDSVHHAPMKTSDVFCELICQRLQQGFQIIVLPRQQMSSYSQMNSNSSPQFALPSLIRGRFHLDQPEEVLMSIGRIFHKLTLDDLTITVTQYRPRHPYPVVNIHYCYRFHAPDNDTYGVSWVDFASEKLENYKWNYIDHYICLRGEGGFELNESLKFWRLRLLILPGVQSATRQIIEGDTHCDIYNDITQEEKIQQREGFLKLLENLNRIRRHPNTRKKSNISGQGLGNSFRERVGSNRVHDRPRSRSGSKAIERIRIDLSGSGRISPAAEADAKLAGSSSSLEITQESNTGISDDINEESKWLNLNSPLSNVIEVMKHPIDGLTFLNNQASLPPWTFISGEAVFWLKEHVEDVVSDLQAIKILQEMQKKKLICHASGESRLEFFHGFYLYYIVPQEKDIDIECQAGDLEMFQKEWLEVELLPIKHPSDSETGVNWSLNSDIDNTYELSDGESRLQLKNTNIDIDVSKKSERVEWGHAKYHSIFQPAEAFEITIEWMVATGNLLAELVQGWARKASASNLQLVPIPSDPFALPFSTKSDPLRGPIFVPLNLECLPEAEVRLLKEEGLISFQENILKKFGFILHRDPNNTGPSQYVHISGSMFVIITTHSSNDQHNYRIRGGKLEKEELYSPHEQYITRHFSGLVKNEMPSRSKFKVGFLWSWNYMITKRWKSLATGDEQFMRKVMNNFQMFCANKNERLKNFWNETFAEDDDPLLYMEQ
ncbi:GATOR complex protein Iml1 isoform X2 [Centruroides vittatus]|uniref:GATOR complex protein Iml1 isoform X2 n=1 Tax=Centruroides vittatus TaxID=120091 RepID=UPI00350FDE6B